MVTHTMLKEGVHKNHIKHFSLELRRISRRIDKPASNSRIAINATMASFLKNSEQSLLVKAFLDFQRFPLYDLYHC